MVGIDNSQGRSQERIIPITFIMKFSRYFSANYEYGGESDWVNVKSEGISYGTNTFYGCHERYKLLDRCG